MKKYFDVLKKCPLFAEINENDLSLLLRCLSSLEKHYKKNDFILLADEVFMSIGVVLSGGVHIIQEDFWGNRSIIARIEAGGLYGEAVSYAGIKRLPVSIFAAEESDILMIDPNKITEACTTACTFHARLIKNMLHILAAKNAMLTQKMQIITQRTTRNKLLSYLSIQARQAGNNKFEIPFNRQELAEYLSVDRSAMSNELSKMREDGILTFNRNQFELFYYK